METPGSSSLPRTRALEAVRSAHPAATDFGVAAISDEFCGGPLLAVTFRTPTGQVQEHYVHLTDGGPLLYRRADELLRQFAGRPDRGPWLRLARTFVSLGGIAGLIALIIAVTVCHAYTRTPAVEVPDFLAHILTSFISFYMGQRLSANS